MSSNLVDSLFEEPNERLLHILLLEFTSLKKFDDYLKVLSYYHLERCEMENCSQCLFVINLRYVYTGHIIQEEKDVKELRNYCIIRKEQFIASKFFIRGLASIEKERLKLDKEFHQILSLWNKTKDTMPSPLLMNPLPTLTPTTG